MNRSNILTSPFYVKKPSFITHVSKADNKNLNGSPTAESSRQAVLDNTFRVCTPENIAFNYRAAGPFVRLVAFVIDMIVVIGGYALLCFALILFAPIMVGFMDGIGLGGLVETLAQIVFGLMIILLFLIYWFYGAFMETRFSGRTVGKRAMNIRAVSVDGRPLTAVQATVRCFLRMADSLPVVPLTTWFDVNELYEEFGIVPAIIPTFLVGLIVMTLNRRHQRLGDIVSRTMVVAEDKAWARGMILVDDLRAVELSKWIPPDFQISKGMARAVAAYVDRRRLIGERRNLEVAAHLSRVVKKRINFREDVNDDLMLCALYYKIFLSSNDDVNELPKPRAEFTNSDNPAINDATKSETHP